MKRSLTCAAIVLAACASQPSPSGDGAGTRRSGNPYSVGSDTNAVGVIPAATLHDARRNKDVALSIEYPTKGGPYPLVIFSPEYGGSRAGYVGLSAFWAGRGYVVIRLSHTDAGATRAALERRMEERRAGNNDSRGRGGRAGLPPPEEPRSFRPHPAEAWESVQTPADWANRSADVTLIIDSLPTLVEQYPEIKERLDGGKIGVAGHSYGALTAIQSATDSRVKAVEAMSPPGTLPGRGLTAEAFSRLRSPTLFLTGTRDLGGIETETAAWRKEAFDLSPAGDKWFVSIQNAGRAAFTGSVGDPSAYPANNVPNPPLAQPPFGGSYGSPQQPPVPGDGPMIMGGAPTGTVRTVSLAFWDAYLKGDSAGRDYLNKLRGRGDLEVQTK